MYNASQSLCENYACSTASTNSAFQASLQWKPPTLPACRMKHVCAIITQTFWCYNYVPSSKVFLKEHDHLWHGRALVWLDLSTGIHKFFKLRTSYPLNLFSQFARNWPLTCCHFLDNKTITPDIHLKSTWGNVVSWKKKGKGDVIIIYLNLARAKSKALINMLTIYSSPP